MAGNNYGVPSDGKTIIGNFNPGETESGADTADMSDADDFPPSNGTPASHASVVPSDGKTIIGNFNPGDQD